MAKEAKDSRIKKVGSAGLEGLNANTFLHLAGFLQPTDLWRLMEASISTQALAQNVTVWKKLIKKAMENPDIELKKVALIEPNRLPLHIVYRHLKAYQDLPDLEKQSLSEEISVALFKKVFDKQATHKQTSDKIFENILRVKDLESSQIQAYKNFDRDYPKSSQEDKNRLLGKLWFNFLKAAARVGNLPLVQWLSVRVHVDQEVLHAAVQSGNIDLVKWLLQSEIAKPPSGYRLDNIDELIAWEATNREQEEKKRPVASPTQLALQELKKELEEELKKESKNRSALESKMFWQRLPYDALFIIFCIAFIVTAAIATPVIWPMFAALGACGVMTIKKAYLDKTKFAKGILGFYLIGLSVAAMLPSVVSGVTYLAALVPLVAAMIVVGLAWYISILRDSKNSTKAKTIGVVVLLFIAALSVVLGNSFAPYLPSAFYGQLAVKLSMIIGFAIAIISLAIAWVPFDSSTTPAPITNWSKGELDNVSLLREDWLTRQPAPQQVQAQNSKIQMSSAPPSVALSPPTNQSWEVKDVKVNARRDLGTTPEHKADAEPIALPNSGPGFFEQKRSQTSVSTSPVPPPVNAPSSKTAN